MVGQPGAIPFPPLSHGEAQDAFRRVRSRSRDDEGREVEGGSETDLSRPRDFARRRDATTKRTSPAREVGRRTAFLSGNRNVGTRNEKMRPEWLDACRGNVPID